MRQGQLDDVEDDEAFADPTAAPRPLDPIGLQSEERAARRWWSWRCACLTFMRGTDRRAVVALVAAHRLACDVLPAPPRAS